MTTLALTIFLLCYIVALLGLVLPVLPGVPIAALGALLAAWLTDFEALGLIPLLIVAGLTVLALVLDYLAGLFGAKRYGARQAGIWGSIVGSLVGVFFFPPFGFLLGAALGAVAAELLTGRIFKEAVRAGFGALLGTLGGVVAKLFILIALGIVVVPKLI